MMDARTRLALELGNILIANAEMAALLEAKDEEIKKLTSEVERLSHKQETEPVDK
jgi:hypothetical protein